MSGRSSAPPGPSSPGDAASTRQAQPDLANLSCPLPLTHAHQIMLGHGSGGRLTHDLVRHLFLSTFDNPALRQGDDAARLEIPSAGRLAVSTDSHIVSPLFFPGGDIGRLAVCGTVNDLAVMGAVPHWIAAGFILEEGLSLETLERVVASMGAAAAEAKVVIVAGDTKVAERGKADGIFIHTTGVGTIPPGRDVSGAGARPGDVILISGTLGDHGMAVLAARGGLAFAVDVESDVAPLNGLVEAMFAAGNGIHAMRDPTRGGLATTLNEIAGQSEVSIRLDEERLPVRPAVAAACEVLGFDPLYVANEGKLVAVVSPEAADGVLAAMRSHPLGREACRIGEVEAGAESRVHLRTRLGTRRVVDMLSGEMLPRIC
ncbi:MAG TPA: hydrogenase expression/formation protein HypE [Anaerolineales bacterium]|nr:hydrogenase expression/formation protein HypE [Anaerolineales bacterium]